MGLLFFKYYDIDANLFILFRKMVNNPFSPPECPVGGGGVSPPRGPPLGNFLEGQEHPDRRISKRFMDLCILFVNFFSCVNCFLVC